MHASITAIHHRTPTLSIVDPRGLPVRSVDYWREDEKLAAQARVNRVAYDVGGRPVKQWDPRLWVLQAEDPLTPANMTRVHSLSDDVVSLLSVDAGLQVSLAGTGNQVLQRWDTRGTRSDIEYDDQLRPVAMFEQQGTAPRSCVERLQYGGSEPGNQAVNLCGQLTRHDSPGGTVVFESFAITRQCTRHIQHFTKDPVAADWPEPIADRQQLLEPGEGAISTWNYGPQGNVLEKTDARHNSQVFAFTLDGLLRDSALKLAGKLTWQTLVSEIEYSADGRIIREVAGNHVETELFYGAADGLLIERRAFSNHSGLLQHLFYDYDRMGNVLSIEDKALAVRYFNNQRIEPISCFNYDSLYQLIGASGWEAGSANQGPASTGRTDPAALSNYQQSFSYDESGNLLKLTHIGAQSPGRELKAARYSNRCLPWRNGVPPTEEAIAAAFDANGNSLMLDQGRSMTWDLRNQLQSVSPVERDSGRNDVESYLYDGGGQRVRKTRSLQTNARTMMAGVRYLPGLDIRSHSGTGEVLQVITATGGLNSVRVLHWETTPPTGVANDQYRYSLVDHLNSCTLELADDARIISREGYYAFGETAWFAGQNEAEVSYKTVRYSGKERDATGLYYYGFRYYIGWLQRWVNPDPARDIDGLNLYRMVRNNPVGLIDRDGLAPDPKDKQPNRISALTALFNSTSVAGPPSPRPSSTSRAATPRATAPQLPARPAQAPLITPATKAAAPGRPPPIKLPTADLSARVLPAYASGYVEVGTHSLMVSKTGSIVVFRGDDRPDHVIRNAGGFYPRDNRGSAIQQDFRRAVQTDGLNAHAQAHVRALNPGYVSTGLDEDSGGYSDTRGFLYRMEIPDLQERGVNDQTLGLSSPYSFTPKKQLDTRFFMNASTLEQATLASMIPPKTHEMTFITPIPNAYIVAYRAAKSSQWVPFH